jgi:hypothetical protein
VSGFATFIPVVEGFDPFKVFFAGIYLVAFDKVFSLLVSLSLFGWNIYLL